MLAKPLQTVREEAYKPSYSWPRRDKDFSLYSSGHLKAVERATAPNPYDVITKASTLEKSFEEGRNLSLFGDSSPRDLLSSSESSPRGGRRDVIEDVVEGRPSFYPGPCSTADSRDSAEQTDSTVDLLWEAYNMRAKSSPRIAEFGAKSGENDSSCGSERLEKLNSIISQNLAEESLLSGADGFLDKIEEKPSPYSLSTPSAHSVLSPQLNAASLLADKTKPSSPYSLSKTHNLYASTGSLDSNGSLSSAKRAISTGNLSGTKNYRSNLLLKNQVFVSSPGSAIGSFSRFPHLKVKCNSFIFFINEKKN